MTEQTILRHADVQEIIDNFERLGIALPADALEATTREQLRSELAGKALPYPVTITQTIEVTRFDSDSDLVYRIIDKTGAKPDGGYISMTRLPYYHPLSKEHRVEQAKANIAALQEQVKAAQDTLAKLEGAE